MLVYSKTKYVIRQASFHHLCAPSQVRWQSLCDAIKLLGCFSAETRLIGTLNSSSKFDYASKHNYDIFEQLFYSLDERVLSAIDLPLELVNACHLARCFHDIALDCVDK